MTTCVQCGASLPSEITCRDYFDMTQAKEFEDPAYFAVHHLSVLCYMLQHNHYSAEGWLAGRSLLDQFVHAGLTPQAARKQVQAASNTDQRATRWRREATPTTVEPTTWTRTIGDVRMDTAANYCEDVRQWAIAVFHDINTL